MTNLHKDFMGKKSKKLSTELTETALLGVLEALAREGHLTKEHLDDKKDILKIVTKNLKFGVNKMRFGVSLHDRFSEEAILALRRKDTLIAIVLFATAIEQRLNETLRFLVEARGISSGHATLILRNFQIHDKLTWVFEMYGGRPFPKVLLRRLQKITDIRNSIVHYKSAYSHPDSDENSHSKINNEIKSFGGLNMSRIYNDFMLRTANAVLENDKNLALAVEALHILKETP